MNEFEVFEYEKKNDLMDNNFHLMKLKKMLRFFKISMITKNFSSFTIIKNDLSQISFSDKAYLLSLETTLGNALQIMKLLNVMELPYVDEKNNVSGLLNLKEICKNSKMSCQI